MVYTETQKISDMGAIQEDPVNMCDMYKDEFERIAVCEGATSEIIGICARAMADISQRISVINQRDMFEKENRRLSTMVCVNKHGVLASVGGHSVCPLSEEGKEIIKERMRNIVLP